jgi:biotin synthase
VSPKQWKASEIAALYDLPFMDLLYRAQTVHREHFDSQDVQLSSLLSIKTGACPEDCAYCPQSGHYNTGLGKEKLLPVDDVIEQAKAAKAKGASRFCLGAAWRNPPKKQFGQVLEMIKGIKELDMETCVTLGMLDEEQAAELKACGLDYYNHNLDTSPEYYEKIITTRTYQDRLDTLEQVRKADLKVCCGGIIGMGETRDDRIGLLLNLANLPKPPESVPINRLIAVKGTPLEDARQIDNFEFIRTIAVARIMMPASRVRISAGREEMSEEMQSLCFFAGANSIFIGEKLLTTKNPEADADMQMMKKLGLCQTSCNAEAEHAG